VLPIENLMKWLLDSFFFILGNYGLAIVLLSILINILIYPLICLSDRYIKDDKDIKDRMKEDIANIKKSYSGRERYFYIRTIYRQFGYSNLSSLKASIGLIIQIPFFFAAFNFLDNYSPFKGVSFGLISDLSMPDNLLFGQNLLPILMTIINLASVYFYSRDTTQRDKLQLSGLSAIFLVFLYFESSALLLYWTTNNLFYFFKGWASQKFDTKSLNHNAANLLLIPIQKTKENHFLNHIIKSVFIQSVVLFFGVIFIYKAIPIAASDTGMYSSNYLDVILYLIGFFTLCVSLTITFYYFLPKKWRNFVTTCSSFGALSGLFFAMIMPLEMKPINAMVMPHFPTFGTTPGKIAELLFFLFTMIIFFFIFNKIRRIVWIAILSSNIFLMAQTYSMGISPKEIDKMAVKDSTETNLSLEMANKFYAFSRESNTIIIILDMFQGNLFSDIVSEYPEIEHQFSGFTYYPNTLSHGSYTYLTIGALVGGVEFQNQLITGRDDYKKLKEENQNLPYVPQNLPYLKNMAMAKKYQHSYSFFNPYLAECRIFSIYVNSLCTEKFISNNDLLEQKEKILFMKDGLYGNDIEAVKFFTKLSFVLSLPHIAKPRVSEYLEMHDNFNYLHAIREYSKLNNLADFANSDSPIKTFKVIHNKLTHKPWTMNSDCQINAANISNYSGIFNAGHCSLRSLNDFFIKLKNLDIYDKTKIIIVSDHGFSEGSGLEVRTKKYRILDSGASALMLVKDFNESGNLKTSMQFMSNIDTYGLALSGVSGGLEVKLDTIKNPEKDRSLIYVKKERPLFSRNITEAYRVKNNIFNEKNWQKLTKQEIKEISRN